MLSKIKYCFLWFAIFHFLIQTLCAKQNSHCSPSSCGSIRNISYPFRLKHDPSHCGKPDYELGCENNKTTFLTILSHKYIVKTINYSNYTIRLMDSFMNIHDNCSFPNHSLSRADFEHPYPYGTTLYSRSRWDRDSHVITSTVTVMSCPSPANNPLLVDISLPTCVGRRRHTYVKLGNLNTSYLMEMCRIEMMTMTSSSSSSSLIDDEKSVSLSEIHSSLVYGFELSWLNGLCEGKCRNCWLDGNRPKCDDTNIYCFIGIYWDHWEDCGGLPIWFRIAILGTTWIIQLAIMYGVIPFLSLRIIIGIPCVVVFLIYKHRRRRFSAFNTIEIFLQNNNNLMPIRYSYSDIKKMTRNFREELGKGGYGSVYKGKLRSGHDVAVKTLSTTKENGQDFINEVATIGRIHHINVVKLVGYCVERSKRVLVYDLMSNGSLDKYIFNKQSCDSLSWERKYRIAIGVARGIEYLHKGCDVQILHFDIKPHNILLDENFIPKISDFGLAKFFSVEKNNVTLTAARGTIGYVAPELMNRSIGEVSYKADIYSFGMLLMEMIGLNTNKAPSDDKSSQYFPYWIYDRINKGKDNEIGNVVVVDDDDEYAKKVTKMMTIVGLWCIQISPISRPSMSEVLKMLEGEDENLQLPPQLSESSQHECDNDQIWEIESADSISLLGCDALSIEQV